MRALTFRFSLLAIAFAVAGTAAGQAKNQLREKLVGYEKIEIAPFKNKVGENLENKMISDLHLTILGKFAETRIFAASLDEKRAFPKRDPDDENKLLVLGTNNDEDAKTLLLFGEIITFNKGSRAKRYVIGGGTGRAEMRANCYLVDKETKLSPV